MTAPAPATQPARPIALQRTAIETPTLPAALAHLRHEPRFVLWKYGSMPNGNGKYPKIPFSPVPGDDGKYHKADTTNPATWGTFDDCLNAMQNWRGWFRGFGTVLLGGEVGIDFDDCYEAGTLRPDVADMVQQVAGRAYTERSVMCQ